MTSQSHNFFFDFLSILDRFRCISELFMNINKFIAGSDNS